MTGTERVTIIISIAGFALAAASFYAQFFHVTHELQASILSVDISKDEISLDIAFINPGNREVLVIDAYPLHAFQEKQGSSDLFNSLGPVGTAEGLPRVLRPGEIASISVHAPFGGSGYYAEWGEAPDANFDEYRDARKVRLGLSVHAMNARGELFNTECAFINAHITSTAGYVGHSVKDVVFDVFHERCHLRNQRAPRQMVKRALR